jgi:hypothetical protein
MRTIPGYFNDEDRELVPGYSSSNQSSSNYVSQASSRSQSAKPGVSVYRNPRVNITLRRIDIHLIVHLT